MNDSEKPPGAKGGSSLEEMAEAARKVADAMAAKPKPEKHHKKEKSVKKKIVPEVSALDPAKLKEKREVIQRGMVGRDAASKHPDTQLRLLGHEAIADSDLSAAQSDVIQKKLWTLADIVTIPDATRRAAELQSFFGQADNWTQEAAPYVFEAQRIVNRGLPVERAEVAPEAIIPNPPPERPEVPIPAVGGGAGGVEGGGGGNRGGEPPFNDEHIEEPPEDYRPRDEFHHVPDHSDNDMVNKFAADWHDRLSRIDDPEDPVELWDMFSDERLKKDIGYLDELVRKGDATPDEVRPWQKVIRKYLYWKDRLREVSQHRGERFEIRPDEIIDSKWLQEHPSVAPYPVDRYLHPDERDLWVKPNGEFLWFYKYILDKIAVPGAEAQPTFVEGIKLESFEHFIEWKYGEVRGREIKHDIKRIRTKIENIHSLNKAITQEGLSAEKLFEVFQRVLPEDFDFFHEFRYVNNTLPLYENVIIQTLTTRRAKYDLLKKGGWVYDDNGNRTNVLSAEQRDHRIVELEKAIQGNRGTQQELSNKQLELARLKDERDEMKYGVGLWDDDFNFNPTKFSRLSERQRLLDRKEALETSLNRYAGRENDTRGIQASIAEVNEQLKRYPESITPQEEQVLGYEGLSTLEREVAEELKLQQRVQLQEEGLSPEEAKKKVDADFLIEGKLAILMARYHMVYSRHIVAIDANFRVVGEGTKAIMRAPVLEDIERVYGWQSFFQRFGMGDKAGAVAMSIFNRETQFHERGETTRLQDTKGVWNMLLEAAKENPEARMAMDAIKNYENQSGISFAQVLNNEVFKTGGPWDGTVWRAEIGVTDEMRLFLRQAIEEARAGAKTGSDIAVLDNLGLAFQIAAESPKTPEGIAKRKYLFEKVRKRDPLLFMQYMALERADLLRTEAFKMVNYDTLGKALSLAQNKINTTLEYKIAPDIDLGSHRDFDRIVSQYLKAYNVPETQLEAYRTFVVKMQEVASTKIDGWAKTDFPLTLRIGDLDWAKGTSFEKIGSLAMPRRGRDNAGMYKATEIARNLLSDPELLFAADPTKVLDKLVEMKNIIVGYAGYDAAETAARDLLATYLKMNENRLSRTAFGWAPGGVVEWGLRQLSEIPDDSWIFKGVKFGANQYLLRFLGVKKNKVADVQNAIVHLFNGRAISYAVEYGSNHGNAFDKQAIANIIATAQDRGLFLKHKHYAQHLMQEFGALWPGRAVDTVRKYYWMIGVALLAATVSAAMKDEEKHH